MLSHHRGRRTFLGRVADCTQSLPETVLGVMIYCMFDGLTFLFENVAHYKIEFTKSQLQLMTSISHWAKSKLLFIMVMETA